MLPREYYNKIFIAFLRQIPEIRSYNNDKSKITTFPLLANDKNIYLLKNITFFNMVITRYYFWLCSVIVMSKTQRNNRSKPNRKIICVYTFKNTSSGMKSYHMKFVEPYKYVIICYTIQYYYSFGKLFRSYNIIILLYIWNTLIGYTEFWEWAVDHVCCIIII